VLAPNFFSSRARGRGAPRCFVERSLERFYVRQRDGDEPRVVRRCRFLRRSQDSFHPDQKNFRQHCTAPWSRAYLLALLARIVLGANESANEARPRRGKARESAAIACRENWTVMIVSWCQRVNLRSFATIRPFGIATMSPVIDLVSFVSDGRLNGLGHRRGPRLGPAPSRRLAKKDLIAPDGYCP